MRDDERRTVGEDRRLAAEEAAIRERSATAGGATGGGAPRRLRGTASPVEFGH